MWNAKTHSSLFDKKVFRCTTNGKNVLALYSFMIALFRFYQNCSNRSQTFYLNARIRRLAGKNWRLFHFAEEKPPASPSAHPPATAARRAPLAELVFTRVASRRCAAGAARRIRFSINNFRGYCELSYYFLRFFYCRISIFFNTIFLIFLILRKS